MLNFVPGVSATPCSSVASHASVYDRHDGGDGHGAVYALVVLVQTSDGIRHAVDEVHACIAEAHAGEARSSCHLFTAQHSRSRRHASHTRCTRCLQHGGAHHKTIPSLGVVWSMHVHSHAREPINHTAHSSSSVPRTWMLNRPHKVLGSNSQSGHRPDVADRIGSLVSGTAHKQHHQQAPSTTADDSTLCSRTRGAQHDDTRTSRVSPRREREREREVVETHTQRK